jgi:hypothetical protein
MLINALVLSNLGAWIPGTLRGRCRDDTQYRFVSTIIVSAGTV